MNGGAQKNFAKYAERIGKIWTKNPDQFNEYYYKSIIARAIIFRSTEKVISDQAWYGGGYRANLVAYTLALLSELFKKRSKSADIPGIWSKQEISESFKESIASVGEIVHENIIDPPHGISNISEWCKKEGCWLNLKSKLSEFENAVSREFLKELVSIESLNEQAQASSDNQQIDSGIIAQLRVLSIDKERWGGFYDEVRNSGLCTPKELGIIETAKHPARLPSDKQASILVLIIERMESEGIII